jgi:tetratricopeptide (TPR) repeat protein
LEAARREFEAALRLVFDYPEAHVELGNVLESQHQVKEAVFHYRTALRSRPDYFEALNNLAWILASDPRAGNRNGDEAVKLATRACELTHYQRPLAIGTLAAAEAEAGRFDEAVTNAQKAHDVALALGRKEVAARNLELQELYRLHRPYHGEP